MSKKSYLFIGILSSALFIGCQPNPTPVNSTQHQAEKGVAKDTHHSTNANGAIKTEQHNTSHREPMNHDEMNHAEMKSAPNAAAQPYDLQFLDTMIAHHEGAVVMAKVEEGKTQNAELKTFMAKIAADQTGEIEQMKRWREQWFAGKPSALNMEMPGMANSMRQMNMVKMNEASGATFDLEFLNQMIPHHEGAAVMAREALTKAEHAEIKTLANQIIREQEVEIKTMQDWKAKWAK